VLNKSKSAISLDISNLEQRLGATLCLRGRGGFAMTEEGQIVYLAALQLFHDVDKFRDRVATGLQRLTGKVSLLVIDNIVSIASAPLVRALSLFGKRHPGVEVSIESANSVMVERGILEEEADIGISVIPRPVATLHMIPLFREELKLYCGKSHPLFAVDAAALNQDLVLRHTVIEPSVMDDAKFASLLDGFTTAGQANSLDSRIMLVLSGLYLGFLPPQYAAPWVMSGDLRELAINGLSTINTFFAVTKKSARQTAAAQRLLQTILAEFRASPVGMPLESDIKASEA
jgi:DNA-binding transcriptional LysR family regulator